METVSRTIMVWVRSVLNYFGENRNQCNQVVGSIFHRFLWRCQFLLIWFAFLLFCPCGRLECLCRLIFFLCLCNVPVFYALITWLMSEGFSWSMVMGRFYLNFVLFFLIFLFLVSSCVLFHSLVVEVFVVLVLLLWVDIKLDDFYFFLEVFLSSWSAFDLAYNFCRSNNLIGIPHRDW